MPVYPKNQMMTACGCFTIVTMVCAVAVGSNNFPSITSDDFNKHIQQLSLDSAQKDKAKVIFDSYKEDLQATLKYRDQMLRWIWSNSPSNNRGYAPALYTEVAKDEKSVEETVQIGLRKLEREYFKQLAGLDRSLIEPVESLRRQQLRNRLLQRSTLEDTAPYGIDFDVAKLVKKIVPDLRMRRDASEQLVSYEEQMDPLLLKLDNMLWRYSSKGYQGLRDLIAKLEQGEVPADEIEEQISNVADFFVEIHYVLAQIRTLNSRTIQAITPLLSGQSAQRLRTRASRYLARYMFESAAQLPDVLILRALELPSLINMQQETLSNLRTSYVSKESVAESDLERIYEQMITKRMYRLAFEAWVREIVLKETIEDPREYLRDELNVKIKKWNALQEQFNQQLKVILTDSQWQKIQ